MCQSDKLVTLLEAANVKVESYWPSLIAKLCEKKNVADLISNVGAGGGAAVAVAAPAGGSAGAAPAAAPAAEEKKVKILLILELFNVLSLNYLNFCLEQLLNLYGPFLLSNFIRRSPRKRVMTICVSACSTKLRCI